MRFGTRTLSGIIAFCVVATPVRSRADVELRCDDYPARRRALTAELEDVGLPTAQVGGGDVVIVCTGDPDGVRIEFRDRDGLVRTASIEAAGASEAGFAITVSEHVRAWLLGRPRETDEPPPDRIEPPIPDAEQTANVAVVDEFSAQGSAAALTREARLALDLGGDIAFVGASFGPVGSVTSSVVVRLGHRWSIVGRGVIALRARPLDDGYVRARVRVDRASLGIARTIFRRRALALDLALGIEAMHVRVRGTRHPVRSHLTARQSRGGAHVRARLYGPLAPHLAWHASFTAGMFGPSIQIDVEDSTFTLAVLALDADLGLTVQW